MLVLLIAKPAAFAQNSNENKPKKKPPPKPFQWVNPLPQKGNYPDGLNHGTFKSPSMNIDVGYCIYLPPGYDAEENATRQYPAVYYLHGGRPGSELKSVKLSTFIDKAMRDGDVPGIIYVFVNGGKVSHYNTPEFDSLGEDVFVKELIPHIDATYRTIPRREGRGLEGFSQGGRGTTRIMFRHPHLFASCAPGGAGYETERLISENNGRENENLVFAEGYNTWDLAREYAKNPHPPLKILIHVGTRGFNYQNNLQYMEFLKSLDIPFEKVIVEDAPHSASKIYEKRGLELMKFHAENFRYAGPRTDKSKNSAKKKKSKTDRTSQSAVLSVPQVDRNLTDIEYAQVGDVSLKLDLYLPPKSNTRPSLVVWTHGGGWRGGSKNKCPITWLTAHNYAIASINFRLSGQATFPALVHDCKGAIRWLRAHADEYGFDGKRVGVAGSSSGGHLAALLATTGDVKELEGDVGGNTDQSSRVQAAIDMFGMTDLFYNATVEGARCDLPDCPLYQLMGGKPSEHLAETRLASPVFNVTKDDPPILILHGTEDRSLVRPFQGRFLLDEYHRQGLDARWQLIEGAGHGGPQFADAERRRLILDLLDANLKSDN